MQNLSKWNIIYFILCFLNKYYKLQDWATQQKEWSLSVEEERYFMNVWKQGFFGYPKYNFESYYQKSIAFNLLTFTNFWVNMEYIAQLNPNNSCNIIELTAQTEQKHPTKGHVVWLSGTF